MFGTFTESKVHRPPVKIAASTFKHILQPGPLALGDHAVVGEGKFVRERLRA